MRTNDVCFDPTARMGCGRPDLRGPMLRVLMPLLLCAVWLASAAGARAGGCDACPKPTWEQLKAAPGFKLERRGDDGFPDHFEMDAGDCTATLVEPPKITILQRWLILRGSGEVWNCPHSKSEDTITVETRATDSTSWTVTAKVGSKLKALVAEVKSEVEAGKTTGASVTEVTTISKKISPSHCHRIPWKAFFQVAEIKAEAKFSFKQTWAWWTKNFTTGAKVHAKGTVTVDCGTATIELGRQAPIAGYFELSQRGCEAEECQHVEAKKLGFFPPLPDGFPWPFGGTEGEPEGESADTTGEDEKPKEGPSSSGELPDPPGTPKPEEEEGK